jgi:uncharacterized protein YqiB (DUF1249 family)
MSFVNPINKSYCLEQLCESNYQKLLQLIPGLLTLKGSAIGLAADNTNLHIGIISNTPYTMTIELSHCFNKNRRDFMAPAVHIRLYLDAQLAEVLNDHARASVAHVFKNSSLSKEIMNYKWRLNYFLQNWLDNKKHLLFNCWATLCFYPTSPTKSRFTSNHR